MSTRRVNPVAAVRGYARVLAGPRDALVYAGLRAAHAAGRGSARPATIRVRSIGGVPVLCRASADVWTFRDTFVKQYHLPPAPLPEAPTIVDLGTNVGYTVADLAHRHPRARILGVELDATNFALARRNTAHLGDRVTLVHAAAWVEDGTVTYADDEDDAFRVSPGGPRAGARTAPARRILTLLDEYGFERVDYLKMDIEGAEAAVLDAPLDWAGRVRTMRIELHPPATYEAAAAALERQGFACRRDERHWNGIVAVRDAVPA